MKVIKNSDLLNLLTDAVSLVDPRLISHGKRTAFIVYCMMLKEGGYSVKEMVDSCMLTALHDVGAYKTEGLDNLLEFETVFYWSHSIYSYIFLKATTPMKDMAESILYHHVNYSELVKTDCKYKDLADKIHLADRIDTLLLLGMGKESLKQKLTTYSDRYFSKKNIDLFLKANTNGMVTECLKNGDYDLIVSDFISTFKYSKEEIDSYLQLLIYFIDFRSQATVSHTLTTCTISQEISKIMELDETADYNLRWGAVFHDVGKIAIPVSILEKDGRLTHEEMEIMKSHVVFTEKVINPYINNDVVQIAVRHHEKLDGSGYPYGLKAEDLTLEQRIMAVADILSALAGRRSYKGEYDKNKIIGIISSMVRNNKICPLVSAKVIENYDIIMEKSHESSKHSLESYKKFNKEYNDIAKGIMERLPNTDIRLL